MTRVTRGFVAKKRRKKVLKLAAGFTGANNRLYRTAQQRTLRALSTAYRDRRLMKRTIRSIWIRRINSFLKNYLVTQIGLNSFSSNNLSASLNNPPGSPRLSYSIFTSKLKKNNILLNRKILAQLAIFDTHTMQKIINL
jgi:large subunit ribosomal protein L20